MSPVWLVFKGFIVTAPNPEPSIYAYYHTHWDREWYWPFRQYQLRLVDALEAIITALESGLLPCFTLDGQTVLIDDALELRPDLKPRLTALIKADKLSVGPWFVMPDEWLISTESLIRNLQLGLKESNALGEKTFTGYLPDTFGHSGDIPTILSHAGIDSAVVWRGANPKQPWFHWTSASGRSVLTYHLTMGYFQHLFHMHQYDPDAAAKERTDFIEQWRTASLKNSDSKAPLPLLFPIGADHLGFDPGSPALLKTHLPMARPVTIDRFMSETLKPTERQSLDVITGELRDNTVAYLLQGTLNSRTHLKQWNRRLEWQLTRHLEPLWQWSHQAGYAPPNQAELDLAWRLLMLNHPHDSICGCSVDPVHRENITRFEQVAQLVEYRLTHLQYHWQRCLNLDAPQKMSDVVLVNMDSQPYRGVVEIATQDSRDRPTPSASHLNARQWQSATDTETALDTSSTINASQLPLSDYIAQHQRHWAWVDTLPAHSIQSSTAIVGQSEPPESVCVTTKTDATGVTMANNHLSLQVDKAVQLTFDGHTVANWLRFRRQQEQGDSYNAAPVPGSVPEDAIIIAASLTESGPLYSELTVTHWFETIDLTLITAIGLKAGSDQLMMTTQFENNAANHVIHACIETQTPISSLLAEGHVAPVIRTYDPNDAIQAHMPAAKLKELMPPTGPIQQWVIANNQILATEGLCDYEVMGSQLGLTLHRGFDAISSNTTGVRGSHAGPPLPTPEGQALGQAFSLRFAWCPAQANSLTPAYRLAHQLYGSVYGYRHQYRILPSQWPQTSGQPYSGLTWNNTALECLAWQPAFDEAGTMTGCYLRLLNPTAQAQTITLETADGQPVQAKTVDLCGRPDTSVQGVAGSSNQWTLGAFDLITLCI